MKKNRLVIPRWRKDTMVTIDTECAKCEEKFLLAYPLSAAVVFDNELREGKMKCAKCGGELQRAKPKSLLIAL